jgi:adenosylcobinamide-phosphate synthase
MAVFAAFILDKAFGDPDFQLHPIRIIGSIISYTEKSLYRKGTFKEGVIAGVINILAVLALTAFILYFAAKAGIVWYFTVSTVIIYFSISVRSLSDHAEKIYKGLEKDIETGRKELSMIVSRDTKGMKEEKIVTSAIESVSENFVDGVVSPLFYSFLFGPLGAVLFKTVSTMDSMLGYRNERYEYFGKFGAKFDDFLNFIPARISIIPIAVSATVSGMSLSKTVKAFIKFRKNHKSPNSAHAISAFAGALDITLGGETVYEGRKTEKPLIGSGTKKPDRYDIIKSIKLMEYSSLACLIFFAVIAVWRII